MDRLYNWKTLSCLSLLIHVLVLKYQFVICLPMCLSQRGSGSRRMKTKDKNIFAESNFILEYMYISLK